MSAPLLDHNHCPNGHDLRQHGDRNRKDRRCNICERERATEAAYWAIISRITAAGHISDADRADLERYHGYQF